MSIESDIPDFSLWTTYKLERLQLYYEDDLRSIRIMRGMNDPEIQLYEKWIAAIIQELDKRHANR
jgi:hypothetical protein